MNAINNGEFYDTVFKDTGYLLLESENINQSAIFLSNSNSIYRARITFMLFNEIVGNVAQLS